MAELKPPIGEFIPCPYCGSSNFREYKGCGPGPVRHGRMLKCMDCGSRTGYYLKRENLVKAANRRISPAKQQSGQLPGCEELVQELCTRNKKPEYAWNSYADGLRDMHRELAARLAGKGWK